MIAPPPQKNARRHHQLGNAQAPHATPAQLSATKPSSHSQRPPVTQWLSRGQRVASGHVRVKFAAPQVVGTQRPVSSQSVDPAQVPQVPPQPSGPQTRDAHSGNDCPSHAEGQRPSVWQVWIPSRHAPTPRVAGGPV